MKPDFEKILKEPQVLLLVIILIASVTLVVFRGIETGLDISGGVRVVMAPNATVGTDTLETARNVINQRINRIALKDVTTRVVSDVLTSNSYIIIDFAGVNRTEAERYLEAEGKFEGQIRNKTIFTKTKRVFTDAQRSGTSQVEENVFRFWFAVEVHFDEARRFADATCNCTRDPTGESLGPECNLVLKVDDEIKSDLRVAAGLACKPVTEARIEGSASSREEALSEMRYLQAVLSTGALPTKLSIVTINDVSPKLGSDFKQKSLLSGLVALLGVACILYIKYREPFMVGSILFTSTAEIFLILGMASLIHWQIDLAAIAGIIAAVGTGVDNQIIITDTMMRGDVDTKRIYGWRARIKRAFFIIFAAASTTICAMVPLTFVGLGAVKGFAITTILGVLAGVLISRPAFIRILENSV
jgi:preprotein translocase subunit SecD